jgi:arylsulfatase
MKLLKQSVIAALFLGLFFTSSHAQEIIHDAEYYIVESQNGKRWATEDKDLDKRLKELKKKHGKSPNIVYILWDDMPFGDAGIPAINKIRGFDTPSCNRIAEEGIMFTRMYVEPLCTPT